MYFFLYLKFIRTHNSTIQNIKNSKTQVQNKTETLKKSYAFLSKVCTLREHINIKNNTKNKNKNKQKKQKICICTKINETKKSVNIYMRHKGIL